MKKIIWILFGVLFSVQSFAYTANSCATLLSSNKRYLSTQVAAGTSSTTPTISITGAVGEIWCVYANLEATHNAGTTNALIVRRSGSMVGGSETIWVEAGANRFFSIAFDFMIVSDGTNAYTIQQAGTLTSAASITVIIHKFKM